MNPENTSIAESGNDAPEKEDPKLKKIRLARLAREGHRPGSVHDVNGVVYQADKNGCWRRMNPKPKKNKGGNHATQRGQRD